MASLRLEPRPWDKGKDNAYNASRLKFRVLLSKSCPGDGLEVAWKWREIEVEPVETSECTMAGSELDAQKLSLAAMTLVPSYV